MTTYGVTNLHPLALLATLAGGLFLLAGRRSQVALALALVACLIPVAQRFVVVTLDFNMIRILILFGWLRLFSRGEIRHFRLNEIDVAFIVWILVAGTMYTAREGTAGALVYCLGQAFDGLGIYFLFRTLLQRPEDAVQTMRYMAVCAVLVVVPMTIERATGRNLFSIFGGVPAMTWVRDGNFRCQGAFSHPIMAGSFGATLVPVFIGMYRAFPSRRMLALVGAISGAAIAILAASSGASISLAAGIGAFALWPLRRHTRAIRWFVLATLIVLHFARDRPVWHLIARISDAMGGEGYHRYALIDAFFKNWREWFLVGTPSTAHWGWMMWDTTNQYVNEAVNGGIFALVAFLILLGLSFRAIGIAGRARGRLGRPPMAQGLWCWGIGCGLFTHATAFISVSYFGQMQIVLYLFFALIAAELSFAVAARTPRAQPQAQRESVAVLAATDR